MEKFQILLDLDGISLEEISESLSAAKNRHNVFKAGEGEGRSGSFFFLSHDRRFIIKTVMKHEKNSLLRILDQYIDHIVQSNNESLLVSIYGLYTIQSAYFANMDIILMQNIDYPRSERNTKLFTFDLKGSVINRRDPVRKGKTLKCQNFIEINSSKLKLVCLDSDQVHYLQTIVERDADFLASINVMDYSLLLVIEKLNGEEERFNNARRT
jgi:hypothetical protein